MPLPPHPAAAALLAAALLLACPPPARLHAASSLRFHGNGVGDIDRVKIRLDDPETVLPGPPADVGDADFTIELWIKAPASENQAGPVSCGDNIAWIYGNILMDRDRFNQDRKWGLSVAGGVMVWGVSGEGTGDHTVCGATGVLDGQWHHVAVQRRRSDGRMWLFVDGSLEASEDGPDGDVSYPDDGVPGDYCGGPCVNSDPFLVFGAEKHDAGPSFPSYSGWLDEVRVSSVLRYSGPFSRPAAPFAPDPATVALYHLDEGAGDAIGDSSGAPGGPSPGERRFGGSPAGPEWSGETFDGGAVGAAPADLPAIPRLTARPSPFAGRTVFLARLARPWDGSPLRVHDAAGRVVATLEGRAAGSLVEFVWNRDGARAGLYFARLRHGAAVLRAAVVAR